MITCGLEPSVSKGIGNIPCNSNETPASPLVRSTPGSLPTSSQGGGEGFLLLLARVSSMVLLQRWFLLGGHRQHVHPLAGWCCWGYLTGPGPASEQRSALFVFHKANLPMMGPGTGQRGVAVCLMSGSLGHWVDVPTSLLWGRRWCFAGGVLPKALTFLDVCQEHFPLGCPWGLPRNEGSWCCCWQSHIDNGDLRAAVNSIEWYLAPITDALAPQQPRGAHCSGVSQNSCEK